MDQSEAFEPSTFSRHVSQWPSDPQFVINSFFNRISHLEMLQNRLSVYISTYPSQLTADPSQLTADGSVSIDKMLNKVKLEITNVYSCLHFWWIMLSFFHYQDQQVQRRHGHPRWKNPRFKKRFDLEGKFWHSTCSLFADSQSNCRLIKPIQCSRALT